MFSVGKLGGYISRGVYTVSGPFHPFGGAVDIIVVEQPDGSFKSSPWHVRFGKFQGVLKAAERIVSINVNGVDANFHMYLDNKGEAFFLQEVDEEEGESKPYPSSEDEMDSKEGESKPLPSSEDKVVSKFEASNRKIQPRISSPRARIFGLSFGRRSMKKNGFQEGKGAVGVDRASSLKRAEFAADLLEVRWTTNLATTRNGNVDSPEVSYPKFPVSGVVSKVEVEDVPSVKASPFNIDDESKDDSSMPLQGDVAFDSPAFQPSCRTVEADEDIPCLTNCQNNVQTFSLQKKYVRVDLPPDRSEISTGVDNGARDNDKNAQSNFSEFSEFNVSVSCALDTDKNEGLVSFGEEQSIIGTECVSQGEGILEFGSRMDKVELSLCPDTTAGLDHYPECYSSSLTVGEGEDEPKDQASDKWSEPVLSIHPSGMDKESSADNGSCNGGEKILCDAEVQIAGNIGMSLVCKKVVTEEVSSDKVLNLKSSTILDSSNCASNSNNELRSEKVCSYTSDLDSLPQVSEERSIVHMGSQPFCLGAEECLGNSIHEMNTIATPSENSDEQLLSFSDLDDPKVDKVEGIEALSLDGVKESLPPDSQESIEEELNETFTRDDKSNQLTDKPLQDDLLINHLSPKENPISKTSPISISKAYKNADLELLAPIVESLPNMLIAGDNIYPYDVPEQLSRSLSPNLEALKLANNDVSVSLESGAAQQQVAHVKFATRSSQISEEIKKYISDPAVEVSLCRHLLYQGMGYEAAALAFDAEKLDKDKFFSLCPDIVKDDKLIVRIGGLYFPWVSALPIAAAIGSQGTEQILEPQGMIAVGHDNKTSEEVSNKPMNSRNGSWKIFPFSFKKSNSVRDKNFESEMTLENPIQMDRNTDEAWTKVKKKKIWAKSPTSEQLASLKLKEGKNVVIFTFYTAMLGNQQVDARIFLWKWNTKIVISDVDGTITKSDVLGQFMPWMGIDWSHTGVTHLFSAVKENGYHFLFLSARSITQASQTRQFLVNLKQDGKALPEAPIVISPDGLFPSLYREVIRRAPHEFKISCLEGIKALFPRDHNPFYAGFGNRDTDEISYLKVGIPKGKIFTINPKGEVVVNRLVDTKSYASLHTLVHDMFPPTTVTEQEYYNSWNFWRLPPPNANI